MSDILGDTTLGLAADPTNERQGFSMLTATGRTFWPCDPRPDEVAIEDIAHSLSLQCRWNGHTKTFYSVAQHCLLVSFVCDAADALWGLLHDAAEAYISDLPRPVKRDPHLTRYLEIERGIELAICERFNLPFGMPNSVKKADEIVLATEARDLMKNTSNLYLPFPPMDEPILCTSPPVACQRFIARFQYLTQPPEPRRLKSETKEYLI
jgi:uncharacterized protein